MPSARIAAALAAGLLAAALAGCGIPDPYANKHHPAVPVPTTAAPVAPAAPAPAGRAPGAVPTKVTPTPAPSAQEALRRFALAWCNWTQPTLIAQRRAMLALAAAPLDAQIRSDIAHATRDQLERVLNASSTGRFLGALPQRDGSFIVLTHERVDDNTGTGDDGQTEYSVYVAGVEQTTSGWMVNRWSPTA